jgi:hypothetical protein
MQLPRLLIKPKYAMLPDGRCINIDWDPYVATGIKPNNQSSTTIRNERAALLRKAPTTLTLRSAR